MTCSEMQAVLPALAEREGPPRVALEAARHLSGCGACAEILLRLRVLHGLLDDLPAAEIPPTFARRVLRALPSNKWKVGGGLGVVVLISLAGAAASFAFPNASLPSFLKDPFDAATLAIMAILRAALDFASMVRDALASTETGPRFTGPALPAFACVASLALFAAFALAGSGAAFGRGALRLRRERRQGRDETPAGPPSIL